jgi:hypothetical protein
MPRQKLLSAVLVASIGLAPLSGCENLPGGKKEQGTVIGGAGGAVAGAAVAGERHRLLGALIGGALGAGGGYLVGANMNKTDPKNRDEAVAASKRAETNPARADDARRARTADLNDDGYVTMDELVAMKDAGLSNTEMIRRLEDTGQVFELTTEQENFLRDKGISRDVVVAMRDMNQSTARRASDTTDVQYERDMSRDRLSR